MRQFNFEEVSRLNWHANWIFGKKFDTFNAPIYWRRSAYSQTWDASIFSKIPQKKSTFLTLMSHEIWLEPKSCFCSIYHNFVINEYFDLKFAVYLAITFHYDVLKGLFDTVVVVVIVVGARSRLAFFRNRGGDSSHFFHYFL